MMVQIFKISLKTLKSWFWSISLCDFFICLFIFYKKKRWKVILAKICQVYNMEHGTQVPSKQWWGAATICQ